MLQSLTHLLQTLPKELVNQNFTTNSQKLLFLPRAFFLDYGTIGSGEQNPDVLDASHGSDIWFTGFDARGSDDSGSDDSENGYDDGGTSAREYASDPEDDGDLDMDKDAAEQYELELQWEPEVEISMFTSQQGFPPSPQHDVPMLIEASHSVANASITSEPLSSARQSVEHVLKNNNIRITAFSRQHIFVPAQNLNTHITHEQHQANMGNELSSYAPFSSKVDWEFACWAKCYGPGSNAISKLLQIDGVSFVLVDHDTYLTKTN